MIHNTHLKRIRSLKIYTIQDFVLMVQTQEAIGEHRMNMHNYNGKNLLLLS